MEFCTELIRVRPYIAIYLYVYRYITYNLIRIHDNMKHEILWNTDRFIHLS